MEPVIGLDLRLPARGSRRRLRDLHAQLREAIVRGRLKAGLLLPSTRELARACGVSRNTATAAYDLLASEGYVVARPGGGTFVAAVASRTPPRSSASTAERRLVAYWRARAALPPASPQHAVKHDFSIGLPEKGAFPFHIWRRLSARALRALSRKPAAYAEPEGRESLRCAVAGHASFTRAVACAADDVVITSGAQQAFDLLARILVEPGKTVVAVEDPGYPPMRRAFEAHGARIAPVRVDQEGIRVDSIPANAAIVCATPSHQFPLGMPLSMERRRALLDLAARRNAVIIEDDYDGEFRYRGRPLDALQTLDGGERVFYVGTFSKSLFPALRLGYVVAPAWARRAVVAAKQDSDWHCGVLQQETLAAFIGEGHLARHVRKMRRVYAERREVLSEAIARHLTDWLRMLPSDCGLHLACAAPGVRSTGALLDRARARGIALNGTDAFTLLSPSSAGLVLGIGRIPAGRIERGIRELASAMCS